ncbi:MAG: WYL domain-containing protein [Ornithinimicrobium sp.]
MVTFESATERLGRLLTMVPWLMRNQGIDIAEAAATFGVSSAQIVEDLQLLFVCGTPGHLPDDLIEASWEDGKVYVGNADTIAHPLRLGRDEALALIVALRALATSGAWEDAGAIERALAKLEAAAGGLDADGPSGTHSVSVTIESDSEQQRLLAQIRGALSDHRRLHLRYLVQARDEATERDVDPMRMLSVDGRWYLEGWCHRAGDVRLFRLDRIEMLDVLDTDGTPPSDAVSREIGPGVFRPGHSDTVITLQARPEAAWIAEQFPVESVQHGEDGTLRVQISAADPRWIVRLVWRLGGAVRVLEPAYVRDLVRSGAQAAVDSAPGTSRVGSQ